MTDRHSGYIVTLTEDVREDDAETILIAIGMVRGVLSVEPVVAESLLSQHIANQRRDAQWWKALRNIKPDETP
jgi:hypothetical protein